MVIESVIWFCQSDIQNLSILYIIYPSGWWFQPSWKMMEFVNGFRMTSHIWNGTLKKSSKPPISHSYSITKGLITIDSPLIHHSITIDPPLNHHWITIVSPLNHHWFTIEILLNWRNRHFSNRFWGEFASLLGWRQRIGSQRGPAQEGPLVLKSPWKKWGFHRFTHGKWMKNGGEREKRWWNMHEKWWKMDEQFWGNGWKMVENWWKMMENAGTWWDISWDAMMDNDGIIDLLGR